MDIKTAVEIRQVLNRLSFTQYYYFAAKVNVAKHFFLVSCRFFLELLLHILIISYNRGLKTQFFSKLKEAGYQCS